MHFFTTCTAALNKRNGVQNIPPYFAYPLELRCQMKEELVAASERAAQLLKYAEQMFGSMTSQWKYVGVTFRDHPPHLYYTPETNSVQIALSMRALDDDMQRDFQLSHEVCHLLYPSVDPDDPATPQTTVLNEGISTYFSVIVVSADYGDEAAESVLRGLAENSPRYFMAFKSVFALLKRDADAIKKLRKIQPMINDVSVEHLMAAELGLTQDEAETLAAIC